MMRVQLSARLALCALLALSTLSCAPKSGGKAARTIVIWEQMDPEERVRFEANLAAFKLAHPGVEIEHTPFETEQLRTQFQTAASGGGGPDLKLLPGKDLTVKDAEKQLIVRALKETGGNRTRAAEKIGMSRRTFHRKLHEYHLEGF